MRPLRSYWGCWRGFGLEVCGGFVALLLGHSDPNLARDVWRAHGISMRRNVDAVSLTIVQQVTPRAIDARVQARIFRIIFALRCNIWNVRYRMRIG